MLDIAFLDCKGLLIPAEAECWKDKAKDNSEAKSEKRELGLSLCFSYAKTR